MAHMDYNNVYKEMEKFEYEQISMFYDKATGLRAATCIHNTVLGPALGGTRFYNYATEAEAIDDVMRLARGMTYKAGIAGLKLGGGKSVVWGDPVALNDPAKREAFWRSFGRYVESMGGRYITAADMNTSAQEIAYINLETEHVVGRAQKSGDPSPVTARGVFNSILACCMHKYGVKSTKGKTVLVTGIGKVGYALCELLKNDGAKILVADVSKENTARAVKDFGATEVALETMLNEAFEIYAPCGPGGIINDETIEQLKCEIISGGANNVLRDEEKHGKRLHEKGIVYAVDYLANAGGLINVYHETVDGGYNRDAAMAYVDTIYDQMLNVLEVSKRENKPTYIAANEIVEARIAAMTRVNSIYNKKR